jgi:hypothetical protein
MGSAEGADGDHERGALGPALKGAKNMNKFLSMSIPSVAFASLASVALTEPAAARKLNSCQIKHSYCTERCIWRYEGGAINSCIQRTCNRQHPGCGPESYAARGLHPDRRAAATVKPSAPRVRTSARTASAACLRV